MKKRFHIDSRNSRLELDDLLELDGLLKLKHLLQKYILPRGGKTTSFRIRQACQLLEDLNTKLRKKHILPIKLVVNGKLQYHYLCLYDPTDNLPINYRFCLLAEKLLKPIEKMLNADKSIQQWKRVDPMNHNPYDLALYAFLSLSGNDTGGDDGKPNKTFVSQQKNEITNFPVVIERIRNILGHQYAKGYEQDGELQPGDLQLELLSIKISGNPSDGWEIDWNEQRKKPDTFDHKRIVESLHEYLKMILEQKDGIEIFMQEGAYPYLASLAPFSSGKAALYNGRGLGVLSSLLKAWYYSPAARTYRENPTDGKISTDELISKLYANSSVEFSSAGALFFDRVAGEMSYDPLDAAEVVNVSLPSFSYSPC